MANTMSKSEIEGRKEGARLWQSMTSMTIEFDAASEHWRVIGSDGDVLAVFETEGEALWWAQGGRR